MISKRLPHVAATCFMVGILLLLLIEAGAARAVAVPLIFTGIALGVAAIASPPFLEGDRERP